MQHISALTKVYIDVRCQMGRAIRIEGGISDVEVAQTVVEAMVAGKHVAVVRLCAAHTATFAPECAATVQRLRDLFGVACDVDEARGRVVIIGSPSAVASAEVRYAFR